MSDHWLSWVTINFPTFSHFVQMQHSFSANWLCGFETLYMYTCTWKREVYDLGLKHNQPLKWSILHCFISW